MRESRPHRGRSANCLEFAFGLGNDIRDGPYRIFVRDSRGREPFSSEVEKMSTARSFLTSIRECAQILPEAIGVAIGKERLNCNVSLLPNGNGGCPQTAPLRRPRHGPAAPVCRVHRDLEQTPALQWLEGGCQRRSVHSE